MPELWFNFTKLAIDRLQWLGCVDKPVVDGKVGPIDGGHSDMWFWSSFWTPELVETNLIWIRIYAKNPKLYKKLDRPFRCIFLEILRLLRSILQPLRVSSHCLNFRMIYLWLWDLRDSKICNLQTSLVNFDSAHGCRTCTELCKPLVFFGLIFWFFFS